MGACKDKDKDVEPENDLASAFVGNYQTTTIEGRLTTLHSWNVEKVTNDQLQIKYTKNYSGTIQGFPISGWQEIQLGNVSVTSADRFTVDETVAVKQSAEADLSQKLEGQGSLIVNSSGNKQINIDLKITNSATGVSEESQYLEFKKN